MAEVSLRSDHPITASICSRLESWRVGSSATPLTRRSYVGECTTGRRRKEACKGLILLRGLPIGGRPGRLCRVGAAAHPDARGCGRLGEDLLAFVCQDAGSLSTIPTDGWPSYENWTSWATNTREGLWATRLRPEHSYPRSPRGCAVQAAVGSSGLMREPSGPITHHLDSHLEELRFRFNRRRSGSRSTLFNRLVQHAVAIEVAR